MLLHLVGAKVENLIGKLQTETTRDHTASHSHIKALKDLCEIKKVLRSHDAKGRGYYIFWGDSVLFFCANSLRIYFHGRYKWMSGLH